MRTMIVVEEEGAQKLTTKLGEYRRCADELKILRLEPSGTSDPKGPTVSEEYL